MSDEARIRALLEEGKITQAEAERLLAALQEIDDGEDVAQAMETTDEIEATDEAVETVLESASRSTVPQTDASISSSNVSNATPRAWVEVDMSAGSLNVGVDPSLEEPTFFLKGRGKGDLERDGEGWHARFKGEGSDWLGGDNFTVTLHIPEGCGIGLNGRAGTVRLTDVPALKGEMRAGTLRAKGLSAIDLEMRAGTFEAALLLTEGEHQLDMRAGTAKLTLLSGSSVQVTGDVKAGSLSLPDAFTRDNRVAGASFSGTLGAGAATLTLKQKAGTLKVRCE